MRRRVRTGFTIVELLVVMGIIAALAGILLPALSRAREQAKRVQCISNMRQLTMAWLNYAYEHKGRICGSEMQTPLGDNPNHWTFGPPGGPAVIEVTNTFAGMKAPPSGFFSWMGGGGGLSAKAGVLWPYLKSEGVYHCPDDANTLRPSSYQINGMLAGRVGTPKTLMSLSEIRRPSTTFVFIEGLDGDGVKFIALEAKDPTNLFIFIPFNSFVTPIYPGRTLKVGGIPGQNHQGTKSNSDGTGLSFADGHAIFWQYSDPRVGNILQAFFQLKSNTNLQGDVSKITDAVTNSPDISQLEGWSGGPVPPGVVQ